MRSDDQHHGDDEMRTTKIALGIGMGVAVIGFALFLFGDEHSLGTGLWMGSGFAGFGGLAFMGRVWLRSRV